MEKLTIRDLERHRYRLVFSKGKAGIAVAAHHRTCQAAGFPPAQCTCRPKKLGR